VDDPVSILGVAGSLRAGSYNRALIRAAAARAPEGVTVVEHDLAPIPFYNGDVEAAGDPEAVQEWKAAIERADAVLIATPEYQHGVPGLLKNALDWASRPAAASVLQRKVVGIMGATPGIGGTARAQTQLRQSLTFVDADMIGPPEVQVRDATNRFSPNLALTDEESGAFVENLLHRVVDRVLERRRLAWLNEVAPVESPFATAGMAR